MSRPCVNPLIYLTQTESDAYLRDSNPPSRFALRFLLEPSRAIGLVPSVYGHVSARNDFDHCRKYVKTEPVALNVGNPIE